jgi:hypothetical protein
VASSSENEYPHATNCFLADQGKASVQSGAESNESLLGGRRKRNFQRAKRQGCQ